MKNALALVVILFVSSICVVPVGSMTKGPLCMENITSDIEMPTVYHTTTIVPPELLQAIAIVESGERDMAVSKDGLDLGRMQLRHSYYEERVRKWGAFDPFNVEDAVRIAACILQENYLYFGSWQKAISAYNKGIAGVLKTGIGEHYVQKVMNTLIELLRAQQTDGEPGSIMAFSCQAYREFEVHIQELKEKYNEENSVKRNNGNVL